MSAYRLPESGELLAERYRVVRLIGEGGMGAVLEAENTLTHKRVAIKLMHPELGLNGPAAQRLLREAQAACRVRHQNVVDVYDVAHHDDSLFLIMELLEGEPLSALLERGELPAHEFISIILCAMRGVAAAHRVGVIHRDIHPGNIFLAREPPNALVPKVLDFGISKVRDDQQRALTGSGVAMGTPLYMSYEQLCSARDIDARTDVYSFGVILYQGLTGRLPFEANALTELLVKLATDAPIAPKQLYPEIPTALDRLILWALERKRDSRIPSVGAFIDELTPFASERAFRTQMTDAQRTLPAIVPQRGPQRPAALTEPLPEAHVRPWSQPAEPLLAFVPEPSAATSGQASLAASVSSSRADPRASTPPPPRKGQLLSSLLVAAATLAVLIVSTQVVRRCSRSATSARKVLMPPPLPALDGVSVAPRTLTQTRLEKPKAEPNRASAGAVTAAAHDAVLARSDDAGTARRGAASSASVSPEQARPLRPVKAKLPSDATPPHARHFRAGEARRRDFLE